MNRTEEISLIMRAENVIKNGDPEDFFILELKKSLDSVKDEYKKDNKSRNYYFSFLLLVRRLEDALNSDLDYILKQYEGQF